MSYRGETFSLPFNQVGFTHNPNIDRVAPTMAVDPSKNCNLHTGGTEKRGGTIKVSTTPISGSPQVLSGFDYRRAAGTHQRIAACIDGKIYADLTTEITSGWTTANYTHFCNANDTLLISDGAHIPLQYTGGASATALSNVPSDWTGSEMPMQILLHVQGVNKRAVAITSTAIYISANEDFTDFSDANVTKLPIVTVGGLVGGCIYGTRIFLFSRTECFILEDADPTVANWGYYRAPWVGGVAHWRLIVPTENDIYLFTEDGVVYSVKRVQTAENYLQVNLTRPEYIDRWIREKVLMSAVAEFHATYDPILRAIFFFVRRTGKSTVNTALVYYVDREIPQAWFIHDGAVGGYVASCSWLERTSVGVYKVTTGDYAGYLWQLNHATCSDGVGEAGAVGFVGRLRTPHLNQGDPRTTKNYKRGWLITKPAGSYNISVGITVDGVYKETKTVSLSGTGVALDTFQLDTDVLSGGELIATPFDIGYVGKRIQFDISNSGVGQTFLLSQMLLDYKPLGRRPR